MLHNCFVFDKKSAKTVILLKISLQFRSGQDYKTLCTARLLQPSLVRALVLHITQESPNANISITTNITGNDATADKKGQVTSPI